MNQTRYESASSILWKDQGLGHVENKSCTSGTICFMNSLLYNTPHKFCCDYVTVQTAQRTATDSRLGPDFQSASSTVKKELQKVKALLCSIQPC